MDINYNTHNSKNETEITIENMSSINNIHNASSNMNDYSGTFDINLDPYIETPWSIIETYFKDQHLNRLVRHQLESYNNFVEYQIMKTIEMFNPVHIKSENDFDAASGKYLLEVFITFENFHIYRPQIYENNGAIKLMFPQEARLRNFIYASSMTLDVNIKYIIRNGEHLENVNVQQKILPNIPIGKLPIMLKSNICVLNQYKYIDPKKTGECQYDAGGYFIINGSEKTVLGQERAAENRVYLFNVNKNNPKYSWTAEIKSIPDNKCISPKQINMFIASKDNGFGHPICIQIPRIKQPLPLFVIFRALGIVTDKEICEFILLNLHDERNKPLLENLQASIVEASKYITQEESLKLIVSNVSYTPINMDKETGAKKKHQFAVDVLQNDLFPHCQTMKQKIYFLGYMANKLLRVHFEYIKGDDRDSYLNKRIDLAGASLNNLLRNYFNKVVKDMEKAIIKEINTGSWRSKEDFTNIINDSNIYKFIKSSTLEQGFRRALSTGDFGIKNSNSNKVGVGQVLNRLTYVASLSHLRRISTPTDKSGKLIPPRKLHNTTWGFICPAETPEGQSVGVVKNLSYMAHVTIYSDSKPLYDYIEPHVIKIDGLKPSEMFNHVKVFINGNIIGMTDKPKDLYALLKSMKYKGIINIYTSIVFDYNQQEIRVCNDCGRITRPVLRVKNNNILINNKILESLKSGELGWDDLLTSCKLDEAVIEYIDPEEQSFAMIATNPKELSQIVNNSVNKTYKYTHCEIHPSTIFGIVASNIPFPDHNQSPRNTYQSAQQKQAMGIYATNFTERMDKTAYVMTNPTRPLVETRIMNMIRINEIPSGCNINVAIMTHTGYNQEDSVLINQGSIDRGLFQITIYHTEKDEDNQNNNGDDIVRCKPDQTKTKGMKFGNYNKLNSKGLMPENTLVENGDVIIAKVVPIKENKTDHTKVIKYEDQSKTYKTVEETYVDKNYIDKNGDGYTFAKVRLRALRKPVIGDKFSSRHGQKGTVGNIIPEEDMPFTKDGVRPDIIINPHAIPSRMTIGQLKETLLGKVLVELGLFGDGTSFGGLDISYISEKLLELGYEAHGNELLYNGLTGEQIECTTFMGPVFYQRLKHMVNDKQHSRSIGPMMNLTRQPAEGRSRSGGLRFGEMERDCARYATPVPLSCGLSVKIGTMDEYSYNVLGWNEKTNSLISSEQKGFMSKGVRQCVDVTFQDGRKISFTDNHKMLTSDNTWLPIKDIIVGETRLKTGVNYPLIDVQQEINECNNWSLDVGITLKTNNINEYFKTLAFMRILGYFWTDGGLYKKSQKICGLINLGHMNDVNNILEDLLMFCIIKQEKFECQNYYSIRLPDEFVYLLKNIKGVTIGRKVSQKTPLPEFVLDPNCPKPIIREFLGGLFGGDGHTCVLGMHRGKRDLLTSVSFSKSKKEEYLESLKLMMEQLKELLAKFDITNVTIQGLKETTSSKKKLNSINKSYQLTLHLSIDELIPFSEKIGFRYCCHKSQRLEAGVSYKRLRNEVVRQHNWIVNRVDEITRFTELKKENPNKHISSKKAIEQAVTELTLVEPVIHEYAIPTPHDISDHLTKGTKFGAFRAKGFPTAEEYLKEIGALSWFNEEQDKKINIDELEYNDLELDQIDVDINVNTNNSCYGVSREFKGIPTMDLKVIDIRPAGMHEVYDIEVENTHSFLANGIVAHNCMVSHGASRFTRERMYDVSDKYSVNVCKKCGLIASYNDQKHIHHCKTCDNRTDFSYVEIPYACKLLFQELTTINVVPRIIT
uniref:DNA-directed RNA polymerase n=1 Tax=viral metagenome TaxID=1070528 RepID=A0A6C0IUN4_9ZZZZ